MDSRTQRRIRLLVAFQGARKDLFSLVRFRPSLLCAVICIYTYYFNTPFRAVFRTLPVEVANELAYVPDQMILDFVFLKVVWQEYEIAYKN